MKSWLYLSVIGLVILTFLPVAYATEYQDVCAQDAQTYCPNVSRENGALIFCLYKIQGRIAPACREKVSKIRVNIHARREECKPDAEKFCQGIAHGGGRINACLKEHLSELSQTCRQNVLSTVRQNEALK